MAFPTMIDRYQTRLTLTPLLGTLLIAAMLLLLEKMLDLFDFVVNEGGPVSVVWRMLGNLIPEYLSLGIPIGVTLGILLAFRRMALSSELDALRSVGIGYGRMLRVPYLFALLFAVANFFIVGYLQPYSRYNYEGLRFELRSGALGASIKVGEFATIGKQTTLRVEQSFANGSDLRGVFVRAGQADGGSLAVAAAHGQFLVTDDPDIIILRLKNGTLVQDAPDLDVPRVLTFVQHDLPVTLPAMENFRARGGRDLELTLPELWRVIRDPATSADRLLTAQANFHRRLMMVAIMAILPLLGVALAVPPKRSTSPIGVFLSVVILVTYHKVSEYGERMGGIGRIDPALAQWVPFFLFGCACAWFYHVLADIPGGEPIGGLDRAFSAIVSLFRRLRRRPAARAA